MTPHGKLEILWDEKKVNVEIPKDSTATFRYKNIVQKLSGGKYTFER